MSATATRRRTYPLSYKGITRDGRTVVGVPTETDPAVLAETLFERGYRALTVYRDGTVVGVIERNPETRRRQWWAESGELTR